MDITLYLKEKRAIVEQALQDLISPEPRLAMHIDAMRYSLLAGGKRLRPILCLATIETLHADPTPLLPVVCALECIHTYSLIHDDLPAMDNDELRRGKPTNHMVFGEAEAILAGDGLLTYAFELISRPELSQTVTDHDRLRIVNIIARAAGPVGMVGGQSLDIAAEGKAVSLDQLRYIHNCKTGALITAAVQTGAVIGKATDKQYQTLTVYGNAIGLAFQMVDDLLNIEGTSEQLGKAAGSDVERRKATYPSLLGLDKTKELVKKTVADAVEVLSDFDSRAEPLRELAQYILTRKR